MQTSFFDALEGVNKILSVVIEYWKHRDLDKQGLF